MEPREFVGTYRCRYGRLAVACLCAIPDYKSISVIPNFVSRSGVVEYLTKQTSIHLNFRIHNIIKRHDNERLHSAGSCIFFTQIQIIYGHVVKG